jgi:hypothetical protein
MEGQDSLSKPKPGVFCHKILVFDSNTYGLPKVSQLRYCRRQPKLSGSRANSCGSLRCQSRLSGHCHKIKGTEGPAEHHVVLGLWLPRVDGSHVLPVTLSACYYSQQPGVLCVHYVR